MMTLLIVARGAVHVCWRRTSYLLVSPQVSVPENWRQYRLLGLTLPLRHPP